LACVVVFALQEHVAVQQTDFFGPVSSFQTDLLETAGKIQRHIFTKRFVHIQGEVFVFLLFGEAETIGEEPFALGLSLV
jgi:hypothetical protein